MTALPHPLTQLAATTPPPLLLPSSAPFRQHGVAMLGREDDGRDDLVRLAIRLVRRSPRNGRDCCRAERVPEGGVGAKRCLGKAPTKEKVEE